MGRKKKLSVEVQNRVKTVCKMILSGTSTREIKEFCEEEYCVSARQIDTYISLAKDMLKKNNDEEIETRRAISNERYNDLYKRCFQIGDFELCIKVQNSIDKINGLNEKRISVDIQKDPYEGFFKAFGALSDEDVNVEKDNE